MAKLHRDNAGYIGCSHEETQDPYYSYNKLSLPLSDAPETVIRSEKTFALTVQQVSSANKYFIDGVQQSALALKQGEAYTFDLSDSSVATHPFRIRKVVNTFPNSLTSGLPSGYSATTSSQYTGTVSDIETDNTSSLYATNNHIDFDLGAEKTIHSFKAVFTSNDTSTSSADYRIELYSDSGFTSLVAASDTAVSERSSDIKTIDHDFGGVQARYVRWSYTGGGRTSFLRYFYPYADTSDVVLTTSGTQGQSGATAKYVVPFGTLGSYEYYCASHAGMGANVSVSANAGMFTGALPILKTTDKFGANTAVIASGSFSQAPASQTSLPVYSNQSATGIGGGGAVSAAFDGSTTTYADMTHLTGQWSKLTLGSPISGVTNLVVGYDGEGDVGYNGSVENSSVSYNGSRQTISLHNGSAITLTDLYFVSQAGNGVCRLYDVYINGVEQTFSSSAPDDADPYAANLVLALPFNGGSTLDVSNSLNSSSTTKVFTTTGSITSNSSHTYYGSSADFNGSSRIGTTTASYDFRFERNDFTIEYWATYDDISAGNSQVGDFQSSTTSGGIRPSYTEGIHNSFYPEGQLNFSIDSNTCGSISGISTGTWYHIACVRENGVVRLYKNGILQSTVNNGGSIESTYMCVGGYYSGSYVRNGQMQDFRVYKGVAKYKANFSPVSTLSVIDLSSSAHAVTSNGVSFQTSVKKFYGGAAEFDGSSSYLSIPGSSNFNFGGGDFTMECWFYQRSTAGMSLTDYGTQNSGTAPYGQWYYNASRGLHWYHASGFYVESPSAWNLNAWVHAAIVRQGNSMTQYINGSPVSSSSFTRTDAGNSTLNFEIGRQGGGTEWDGFIQDFRIYKSIAKYTSSFSPPERSLQGTARRYPSGVYVVS